MLLLSTTTATTRCDLWRYLLIWSEGGVYADADAVLHRPLRTVLRPEDDALTGLGQVRAGSSGSSGSSSGSSSSGTLTPTQTLALTLTLTLTLNPNPNPNPNPTPNPNPNPNPNQGRSRATPPS